MKMTVKQISPKDWAVVSEDAHKIVFGTHKPASRDRIDFALMTVDEQNVPLGYVTCREWDNETLYWQFGGMFPDTRGTPRSFRVYKEMLQWATDRYFRITMLVENTNVPMLKFALKVGFKIIGVRNYSGTVLLEHSLELKEK